MGISTRNVIVSDGGGRSIGAGAGNSYSDYNKLKDLGQNIAKRTGLTAQLNQVKQNAQQFHDNNKKVQQPQTSGYTVQDYTPSYSGSNVSSAQKAVDDQLNEIKRLIAERAELERNQYGTRRNQQLAQAQNDWEDVMRQNNLNYVRTDNWIKNMFGGEGLGYSNRIANRAQWGNNNYKNDQALANLKGTIETEYNRALADIAARESEGIYNRVIPVLTNREINENNLSYRERANLQDLDYRRYLASIGLM